MQVQLVKTGSSTTARPFKYHNSCGRARLCNSYRRIKLDSGLLREEQARDMQGIRFSVFFLLARSREVPPG